MTYQRDAHMAVAMLLFGVMVLVAFVGAAPSDPGGPSKSRVQDRRPVLLKQAR
jgi:hypothetical protein